MSRGTALRLVVLIILLLSGFVYIRRTSVDAARASLVVTAVICAVTTVYAWITFEILIQNRAMAQAATDSTMVMERSLRFSYAPSILYKTLNTKDPTLQKKEGFVPVNNEDYQRAMKDYAAGNQQQEFVFGIIQNVGIGVATNLVIEAEYNISDMGNLNKNYTVKREAVVRILQPRSGAALLIFASKLPTSDDRVELVSATVTTSDLYRDALGEPNQRTVIHPKNHDIELAPDCIIRIS